ncbi:MAG: hypothetical protein JXO72_14105 [Vicinamibacteria bacterium]|nr:hypothetical protein [Vicinamibacteria bacterium]
MSDDKKTWGHTVLGWFIEKDHEGATDTTDTAESRPDEASSTLPVPQVFTKQPPAAPGGHVDYDGVFEAAGIDDEERERVRKASELLGSLPAETSLATKKQIVEASLKAFGVPIDKIIETGVAEIQALESYIRTDQADTQKLIEESNARIANYEQEIRNIRTVMDGRVRERQGVQTACNAKKLEVQRVLEFFGRDEVARVVRESSKLIDPSAE